jgi:hypothetical protein
MRRGPLEVGAVKRASFAAASTALLLLASSVGGLTAPPDEAIVGLEQYSTAKGRSLASTYQPQMRAFHDYLYHCVPWIDVHKGGIGFRSPKGAGSDERYLTVWIWVEQSQDRAFAAMSSERRASAMFSRYGVPLLRRMTTLDGVARDTNVDGFAVIVSWLKPGRPRPAVNETLVSFVDRTTLLDFLATNLDPAEFLRRARLSFFEGTRELDRPNLDLWPDSFLETYRPSGYVPAPGSRC